MTRRANPHKLWFALVWFSLALTFFKLSPHDCHALCATVKIEIRQELTLERQAFDAHMRINNGLSHIPIENVAVTVKFADEHGNPIPASSDPGNTSALFFIRIDTMDNIDNVEGTGSVAPETSADIHWLIVPAAGASNGLASGTLYFVGAAITYTAAGQSETIEVTPDYIFVKPMPQLVLDYFLPRDVYGDDAWSSAVEAPVPFYLGLRVRNKGFGYARALKVESAQPKIMGNDTGLLIGFQIEGSTVNGRPATNSLLADFGDIPPDRAGLARWIMSCTVSGRFTAFDAEFSHADELGGKMTSLIAEDDVRTHFLVKSVLVDAEGRDTLEDFLANDDDVYRVYESDNIDSDVTHQSANASLTPNPGGGYKLTTPPTAGLMFARVIDPTNGDLLIKEAFRSDGKRVKSANVWLSKTRAGSGPWQYFVNIFDHNTPGVYTITFQSAADVPQAPVIAFIPEKTRIEGQQLSFMVTATDPNGTIPGLAAERLPVGASFEDQGNGSAIFNWTPSPGQAGRYVLRFIATDGLLESARQVVVRIFSQDDTDGDGLLDGWEREHFDTLERDGSGDFDGDGISDLEEFLNGLDPAESQSVPSVPEIIEPQNGAHIDLLTPELEISNSIDPEGDDYTYTFELYADKEFKVLVASQSGIIPQINTTVWTVPNALTDNRFHYWRVKATDATGSSNWAYGHFFTDLHNDPPTAPGISFPADGTSVDTPTPVLEISSSRDLDDDLLTYDFEVYTDSAMSAIAASVSSVAAGGGHQAAWTVDAPLQDGYVYYWRAVARDSRGARTPGPLASFLVETANAAPSAPVIATPLNGSEITSNGVDLVVENSTDPDGDDLTYIFEIDTEPSFEDPGKVVSEPISPMDQTTTWSVEGLADNTRYYWRVKSNDGAAESRWSAASFFVNAVNERPPVPELKNPGAGAWVNTRTPVLAVHPVSDIDQDTLRYRFEIYTAPDFTQPAGYIEADDPVWPGISPLSSGTWHYWRVQAVDQHGIPGEWSATGSFFVKVNGVNLAPQLSFLTPDAPVHTNAQGISARWSDSDPDSNATISLYYDTDTTGEDGVLIVEGVEEDPDGTADYYTWDIGSMEGTFYIYAVIDDTFSRAAVYCPWAVTIDHTPPTASAVPAGATYAEAALVALATDEAAVIYYTLDGSEPTIGSDVYSAPLTVSQATTIRFIAVDTAGNQSAVVTETYLFEAPAITVSVSTDKERRLAGTRVYAFTSAGGYTGRHSTTDGEGQVHFDPDLFADGDYKFRVDYLGGQYWSSTIALPGTRSIQVVIPEESVVVTIDTAAGPASGVRVYLFSQSGAYLGLYLTTDANGQVIFNLPVGMSVVFRADLYGSQYWSPVTAIAGGAANAAVVNAGGGLLQVEVNKGDDRPLTGIRVYLFNTGGSYLDRHAVTDDDGRVGFNVPAGDYRLRADYLGYQFWSADTQVVTDTSATLSLPHQQIQVMVEGRFEQNADPLEGIKVYLFSAAGNYMGTMRETDDQGRAKFELPEKAYKVRADVMGRQFWSDEFNWQDPAVSVPMSDARVTVTGAGHPLMNVRVSLFSEANSYLGTYADTDTDGQCLFRLPEGTYRFRADYQGGQFWSANETLTADQFHEIGISTGGGSFAFTILKEDNQPLAGADCYLFNSTGSYLGLHGITGSNGRVAFDLSAGAYKLRVDYLGCRFWSEVVQVPEALSAEMTIAHAPVDVTIRTAAGPAQNIRVYLFKEGGAYQGLYLVTDDQGRVRFNLPAGAGYMFRADLFGNQYWSDPIVVPQAIPGEVLIDTGGGPLQLVVKNSAAAPMSDLRVYLFSQHQTYLNVYKTTDTSGTVLFDLPQGAFRLRVDYLGYSYWTDDIQVPQSSQVVLPIDHQPVNITVQGRFQGADAPFAGVRVFLFTPTGSYLGRYQDTDAGGRVTFHLPGQKYMARADHMGRHYWCDVFNHQDHAVTIPMADVQVAVTGAGLPKEGIRVYLFSESGAYLGRQADTDAAGRAVFHVPAGTYLFRADYQGHQFWSTPQAAAADQVNPVVISVGGGTFALTVRQDAATPMAGVRCYVFNGTGSYTGYHGATDDQGVVRFDLADGNVRFRADYLGHPYWSESISIPAALSENIDIPHHDITVDVTGNYLGTDDPLSGQRVYLFTPAGSYTGLSRTTDESGQARFTLPDQAYQIRADYLGRQYWSQPFQSRNTAVHILQGAVDIHVQRNMTDVSGARVYLFTPSGSYLGRYAVTDSAGWVAFILPEGAYRFRVDLEGVQSWSADTQIVADQTSAVDIDRISNIE
ncbi:MAG: hypothetical protein C4519_10935 [Desulfobacteraceae bacterium]|nr:MAG: hypothetical protein C4519_10935 [Desulfobacteraceae bacterium]